jgi:hypothetical protein
VPELYLQLSLLGLFFDILKSDWISDSSGAASITTGLSRSFDCWISSISPKNCPAVRVAYTLPWLIKYISKPTSPAVTMMSPGSGHRWLFETIDTTGYGIKHSFCVQTDVAFWLII